MKEEAVQFGTSGLVGVVAQPEHPDPDQPAIILLNSGLIHKTGPNRLYVDLARQLAATGMVVLRFDLSAIGDSPQRGDTKPFRESSVLETREAMEFLRSTRGCRSFILGGICTGAVVAFRTALGATDVTGLIMVNAQDLVADLPDTTRTYIADREQTHYYLKNAILRPRSWLKLLSGRASYRQVIRSLMAKLRRAESNEMAPESGESHQIRAGLRRFLEDGGSALFLYSAGDRGIDELHLILGSEWDSLIQHERLVYTIMGQTDHMFTLLPNQRAFIDCVTGWIDKSAIGSDITSHSSRSSGNPAPSRHQAPELRDSHRL